MLFRSLYFFASDSSQNDYSYAEAKKYSASANNGGTATWSAMMSGNTISAQDSGVAVSAAFGDNATVSNAVLQSQVSDTTLTVQGVMPSGAYTLTTGAAAFQNFAGLQALNLNTGANASQNANVSVSVSAESITVN